MAWIEFLLRLRATNMPSGKMQAFAKLRGAGDATAQDRRQMLEEHLADVLTSIEAMQKSVGVLQAKIAYYRSLEQSLASDSHTDERETDDPGKSL